MLKECFEEFTGDSKTNCWRTGSSEVGCDPELGYGCNAIGKDGDVVKVWEFVDNFLNHGPTYEKSSSALTKFLDLAMDCGVLCHRLSLCPRSKLL